MRLGHRFGNGDGCVDKFRICAGNGGMHARRVCDETGDGGVSRHRRLYSECRGRGGARRAGGDGLGEDGAAAGAGWRRRGSDSHGAGWLRRSGGRGRVGRTQRRAGPQEEEAAEGHLSDDVLDSDGVLVARCQLAVGCQGDGPG